MSWSRRPNPSQRLTRMENKWLNEAVAAIRRRELDRARRLLEAYVDRHPTDERGWLWVSRTAEHPLEKKHFLLRALALNPTNRLVLNEWATFASKETAYPLSTRWRRLERLITTLILGVAAVLGIAMASVMAPKLLGYQTVILLSGSMEPAFSVGDVVIAESVPSDTLHLGDVIVFAMTPDAELPTVHRIVNIREQEGKRYYTTRGDANLTDDTVETSLPSKGWRVTKRIPFMGYVMLYAAKPAGMSLLIGIPLIGLLSLQIVEWLKRRQRIQGI